MRLTMNLKLALALGALLMGVESSFDKDFKIHTDEFVKYFPLGQNPPASAEIAPAAAAKLKLKLRHTTSDTPGSSENEANVLTKRGDYCGHSTFVNKRSNASPSTSDCWKIYNNIAGGGRWQVWTSAHRTLVSYGGCAFGVEIDQDWASFQYVGAWDIRDLIRDSINKFASGGKVGAKGAMTCGVKHTEWGLF
ncbi:putative necrosis-inducing factor-domain-containing protein [Apiosordaria backusii]|uniref:Necrosis-inducing factor-domain-containing protein n=1 Tax=Apiosordaria backusii TaxID=314023 RepID=A0AA40BJD4_9PEZI|nr:putative necrosis-inducing factor-domain-containing protein [Apiosordaria backusii]